MGAGVPGHKKLFWALAYFEDEFINWYSFLLGDRAPKEWEGLEFVMRKHFGAISETEARAQLAEVKHESSAQEYLGRFNRAVAKCWNISEQEKAKAFIRGLRPEWRMAIAGTEPTCMIEAINKAVAVEEIWNETRRSYKRYSSPKRDDRYGKRREEKRSPRGFSGEDSRRPAWRRGSEGTRQWNGRDRYKGDRGKKEAFSSSSTGSERKPWRKDREHRERWKRTDNSEEREREPSAKRTRSGSR